VEEVVNQDTLESIDAGASSEQDDLRAKALALLDFHAVRQRVAERVTFFPARELALRMTPSYRRYEVEELQRETAEGRLFLDQTGDVDLHTTEDILPFVMRAALGGILTGMELLAVASSLDVQRRARTAVLRGREGTPSLADMALGIPELPELGRQIRARITQRGEVADDATPSLRAIRSQVRQAYERVTHALTRIIQSSTGQEALQDQVISVRGDRLVVQVKSEMRRRVPGIVHDASNTGATLFIEPFATVELCNQWRELALQEQREIERVLRDLSVLVGELAGDLRRGVELTARLDFILARARYSAAIRGVAATSPPVPLSAGGEGGPKSGVGPKEAMSSTTYPSSKSASPFGPPSPPAERGTGGEVRLLNARHPLLGSAAVPVTINIGPGWSALVITGPNTGGKTVAMKTVGLLAMMHQSGLHIPADQGSALPVFDGIYADVGDQQSIERSVSTFSSHMRSVIGILAQASTGSLVLLDELGSSTDPEEGAALAKAILDHLASRGISTIATTHYRAVAAYAQATPGMANASVELDPVTLRPTYRLTMGIPGRSYAMAVASHLGLPQEIMQKAQSLMEPQHLRFEDWLNELQRERHQLQARLQEAEEARAQAEASRRQLEEELEYLATHREDILEDARREAAAHYEEVRRKLRRAEAATTWAVPPEELRAARAEVSEVGRELKAERKLAPTPPRRAEQRPVAVGDLVCIRGLNLQGTVVALPEQGGEATVSIGKVRINVGLGRLSRAEEQPEAQAPEVQVALAPGLTSMELDMRGMRVEEALARLEDFLDKAVRDGLSSVRIIHGRGTGVLRQVVREHLARHPLAKSFEPEARERGGNGATVVELA
jgi:DNA mismatch repair protein MutS2